MSSSDSSAVASKTSSVAPAKVFVFGGNGLLGSEIVSALTSAAYSKHFPVVAAVVRQQTLESTDPKKSDSIARLRESGAVLVSGDTEKASAAEIAKWIRGYDVVVSSIGFFAPGQSIEHKILEAVQLAGIKWYIPAIFGFDVYKMYTAATPFMGEKRNVIEAVKATKSVNYFVFNNGLFLDYLIAAKGPSFAGIDVEKSTISAPYSFDVQLSTTSVVDIARLTAEALTQREQPHVKNQILQVAADTLSYNDLHALLEKHFQKKFSKVVVSREEAAALVAADVNHQDAVNRFKVAWGESAQESLAWPVKETFNAKYAAKLKLTTVNEQLQKLFPQSQK